MEWNQSYRDILYEIELWEIRVWELESQLKILMKEMFPAPRTKMVADYSGMPGGGSMEINFVSKWGEMQHIEFGLIEARDILSLKHEAKRRMESKMKQFNGLEYQVAYQRDVERRPLQKIADDLGYSYEWIRKVSMKTKRTKGTKREQMA